MAKPNMNNVLTSIKLVLYENFGLKGSLDVYSGTNILMIDKYVLQTKKKKILGDQNYSSINILSWTMSFVWSNKKD